VAAPIYPAKIPGELKMDTRSSSSQFSQCQGNVRISNFCNTIAMINCQDKSVGIFSFDWNPLMSTFNFCSKSLVKVSLWMSAIAGSVFATSVMVPPALSQESEMRQVDSSIYVQPEDTQIYTTADTAAAIALALVGAGAIGLGIRASKKYQRSDGAVTFAPTNVPSHQSDHTSYLNQANRSLQRKLLLLLHEDHQAAERLVQQASFRYPGKSPDWYLEKVIYDLHRDRGIAG
jgi:hypothetical protein